VAGCTVSTGFEITFQRRFGGHGGVATEWEYSSRITCLVDFLWRWCGKHPKSYALAAPLYWHTDTVGVACVNTGTSFNLRQGVSAKVAGGVAGAWCALDKKLFTRLMRKADKQAKKEQKREEKRAAHDEE